MLLFNSRSVHVYKDYMQSNNKVPVLAFSHGLVLKPVVTTLLVNVVTASD
jgi:broad specificity phosphatase PhoE